MKILKNKEIGPVYYFIDPDTGYKYHAIYPTFKDLINHIVAYRRVNNLPPITDLETLVELFVCEIPENVMYVSHEVKDIPLGIKQYIEGAGAFLSIAKAKIMARQVSVDVVTANKRASICAKCPYNTHKIEDKPTLQTLAHKLMELISAPSVQQDKFYFSKHLGACSLCGCGLKSKVWLHREHFEHAARDPRFPEDNVRDSNGELFTCWQIKEVE